MSKRRACILGAVAAGILAAVGGIVAVSGAQAGMLGNGGHVHHHDPGH